MAARQTADTTTDDDMPAWLRRARAMARSVAGRVPWRPVLGAAALALAGWLIYRLLRDHSLDDIVQALRALPPWRLALAGGFAAASYACLTLFDWLALRYAGTRVPYPYAAMTSFAALSLGHNIGFAALSSGAVRYRLYARRGLDVEAVAKVIAFCGLTVALGLLSLAGAALCGAPALAAEIIGVSPGSAVAIGLGCLAAAAGYLAACATVRRELRLWRWQLTLPDWRLALAQVAVGALNFALVAGCLYEALAGVAEVAYPGVAAAYVLANAAALVSHVPGGLGVIESVIVVLVPGATLIGALVAFRLVYYLVPLPLGALVLLGAELAAARQTA